MANGLRYWRWGGRGYCLGVEKTRSQKMLVNRAESPASSAPLKYGNRSFSTRERLVVWTLGMVWLPF